MNRSKYTSYLKILLLFSLIVLVSGCKDIVLINPKGQIGVEQRSLILTSLGLMLIVVIPVIIMTFIFAIKYCTSNTKTMYSPIEFQSNKVEFVMWTVPILIIIFLATITWKSTHSLDPSKSIISNIKPINIQVIAMNWKWLFIYPIQEIATVNEIVFPSNVPIRFEITSNSVMNSFFIPQLGSQIYAMAGMNSALNLIANEPGNYKGIAANFSGQGFSGMKFTAVATLDQVGFNKWVKKVKASPKILNTINAYEQLAVPSEYHPVEYFSFVKPNLFQYVISKFMPQKNSITHIQDKERIRIKTLH